VDCAFLDNIKGTATFDLVLETQYESTTYRIEAVVDTSDGNEHLVTYNRFFNDPNDGLPNKQMEHDVRILGCLLVPADV